MVNRLELAKRFAAATLAARSDGIGALLSGSVARGEDTDTSDVDVAVYVSEDKGEGYRSLARWEEGVYIEAQVETVKGLGSLDEVMSNPIAATRIRDAVILDDRAGFFAPLQKRVQEIFMEPKWLRLRVDFALNACRQNVRGLRDSIASENPVGICDCVWWLSHALPAVRLYLAGITPSSTRKLLQLASLDPTLRDEVFELECSLPAPALGFDDLRSICERYCALTDNRDMGGLSFYMIKKAASHVSHGHLREGVDMLWCAMGALGPLPQEIRQEGLALRKAWLHATGWVGPEVIAEKLRLAERLTFDAETVAARAFN